MSEEFIEMWQEADYADAAAGGMDSVPEDEKEDYALACLMNVWWNDIRHHKREGGLQ